MIIDFYSKNTLKGDVLYTENGVVEDVGEIADERALRDC